MNTFIKSEPQAFASSVSIILTRSRNISDHTCETPTLNCPTGRLVESSTSGYRAESKQVQKKAVRGLAAHRRSKRISWVENVRNAVKVEGMVTHSPCDVAILRTWGRLVRLTFDTGIHDMITANGTVVDNHIYSWRARKGVAKLPPSKSEQE